MMKRYSKVISLVLTLLLCITMVTGCSSSTGGQGDTDTAASGDSATQRKRGVPGSDGNDFAFRQSIWRRRRAIGGQWRRDRKRNIRQTPLGWPGPSRQTDSLCNRLAGRLAQGPSETTESSPNAVMILSP